MLSTGSTLLNLASTGHPFGGFARGKYHFIVGDSASGKTFLSLSCFAEACINKVFDNHRLIFDDVERGMQMDIDHLFSEEVADRIEPPEMRDGEPVYSDTIESFYYHLDDLFEWDKTRKVANGRPFIYVLDSMDALDSEAADKKFSQTKRAFRKKGDKDREEGGEDKVSGSYGDGKAKVNSANIRKMIRGLEQTGSILIILSQTRDNFSGYGGKTRGGGHALRFYACTEFWASIVESIKKEVNGKPREVGVRVKLRFTKNRLTGQRHAVEMDIYPSFGIDDVGACVDYLVEENYWAKEGNTITAKGLELLGTRDKLIRLIEKRGLEDDLRGLCGKCWKEVEEACSLSRKNRYAVDPETI